MTKMKVSVTVDPAKVAQAQRLLGRATLSKLIDVALERLIVEELERRHVAGYLARPPAPDEAAWAEAARDPADVADDVDWAGLYGIAGQG